MVRNTRPVSWIKAARKAFEAFPQGAQVNAAQALTVIAEGGMPDVAKPLKGLGTGVLELALRHQGDAFRVVFALQLGADIWVIHAFQKKAKCPSTIIINHGRGVAASAALTPIGGTRVRFGSGIPSPC